MRGDAAEARVGHLTSWRLRAVLATLLGAAFLGAIDHTIVSTALSTIAGELGAVQHLSWIVVSYTMAAAVLLPFLGRVGDRLGVRRVFIAGLVVFILASLLCGYAQSLPQIVAARLVQGCGAAAMQLMSQTIIASVAPPRQRAKHLSIVGLAFPVAIVVGPVLGGLITETWGWPWIFWINVPLGALAVAGAWAFIPRISGDRTVRIDPWSVLLFVMSSVSLILLITWWGEDVWQPQMAVAATIMVLGGAAWVLRERRLEHPLVPLSILTDRGVLLTGGLAAVIGVGLFAVVAYVPTYIQMAYLVSPTTSGLVPMATVFGMLVASLGTGWLVARSGRYRRYPLVGSALAASGLLAMAFIPTSAPLAAPMIAMAAVGVGTGCIMNLLVAVAQSVVPAQDVGASTAMVNLVRQLCAAAGGGFVGSMIGSGVVSRLPDRITQQGLSPERVASATGADQALVAQAYDEVLSSVFLSLAGVYLLGIVIAAALPRDALSASGDTIDNSSSQEAESSS
ncbi:MFS transporter [Nesterenkonia sp. CL21]|uniref:MFS transporter n=1 Tax=Nesterenkonia sp. CL21 TaxID=3064894 RepID=UPI002878FE37|nr:MFS transporter [Nesterenkonia sp. CL21]MDS2173442.1 MFS transporter [Nesterenkonia sp. CL21]